MHWSGNESADDKDKLQTTTTTSQPSMFAPLQLQTDPTNQNQGLLFTPAVVPPLVSSLVQPTVSSGIQQNIMVGGSGQSGAPQQSVGVDGSGQFGVAQHGISDTTGQFGPQQQVNVQSVIDVDGSAQDGASQQGTYDVGGQSGVPQQGNIPSVVVGAGVDSSVPQQVLNLVTSDVADQSTVTPTTDDPSVSGASASQPTCSFVEETERIARSLIDMYHVAESKKIDTIVIDDSPPGSSTGGDVADEASDQTNTVSGAKDLESNTASVIPIVIIPVPQIIKDDDYQNQRGQLVAMKELMENLPSSERQETTGSNILDATSRRSGRRRIDEVARSDAAIPAMIEK